MIPSVMFVELAIRYLISSVPELGWFFLLVLVVNGLPLIFTWKKEGEKLGRLKYLLPILFLANVLVAGYAFIRQDAASQKRKEETVALQTKLESMSEQVAYLNKTQEDLLIGNMILLKSFNGLQAKADTILAAVVHGDGSSRPLVSIPSSQTQVMEVREKRTERVDTVTGHIQTDFVFRSRYVTPLRDIRIEMLFDAPILHVLHRFAGAVVFDQGTRDTLASPTRYVFVTGYLSQSNDIVISTESLEPVRVSRILLSP